MNEDFDLLLFSRLLTRVYDRYMEPVREAFELSPVEITIVSFLHNHPARNSARDMTELRMLSKSRVSEEIDCLMARNLLIKEADPSDRRVQRLFLTEDAEPIRSAIAKQKEVLVKEVFGGFERAELEEYFLMSERLMKCLKEKMEE